MSVVVEGPDCADAGGGLVGWTTVGVAPSPAGLIEPPSRRELLSRSVEIASQSLT